MPDKLILKTEAGEGAIASDAQVYIEIDGISRKLTRCKAVCILADDRGNVGYELAMYAKNTDAEVVITPKDAEAILQMEYGRQLAFLTDDDSKAIRELSKFMTDAPEGPPDPALRAAIKKIADVLESREDIPF